MGVLQHDEQESRCKEGEAQKLGAFYDPPITSVARLESFGDTNDAPGDVYGYSPGPQRFNDDGTTTSCTRPLPVGVCISRGWSASVICALVILTFCTDVLVWGEHKDRSHPLHFVLVKKSSKDR